MSGSHPGPRTPPERLTELASLLDDEATRATFARGLAIGALVGAAIAGTLLRRRRRRRRSGAGSASAVVTEAEAPGASEASEGSEAPTDTRSEAPGL